MFKKGFSTILVVVIVLVVVAGGVLSWQYWPESVDTSNWVTYRSIQGGWEVSFPADYYCYGCDLNDIGGNILLQNSPDIRLRSEDYNIMTRDIPVFLFEIESPDNKPSEISLFDYFKAVIDTEAEKEKYEKQGIEPVKIHEAVEINSHNMVMIEIISDDISDALPNELYFFEKDDTTYVKLRVVKGIPAEADKRASEIETIVSTFKFID